MAPSYASGVGSKPLIGETIGALLERVAQELPEHPALISRHQGTRLTYAALERAVFLDSPGWDELLALGDGADVQALRNRSAGLQFDDPINIQYTSGTTGFPKGATLSHHNILNNGFFVGELCGYTFEDRVCIPVPLYHCFGMVMGNLGCVTHGATMVYPSDGFDATAVLEAAQAERATALYGVPTMFIAEL